MALAFIGLGGNIGDTQQFIKDAIVCLAQHPELRILTRSCICLLYTSDAADE